jgi:hypothetical protein
MAFSKYAADASAARARSSGECELQTSFHVNSDNCDRGARLGPLAYRDPRTLLHLGRLLLVRLAAFTPWATPL